jgi:hypothetical protein
MARLSLAALILVGYCPVSALAQVSNFAGDLSYLDPLREAARLSSSEAARLENQLLQRPDDLSVRARLISHYFQDATAQLRISHVLWVIQHHPGSKLAGSTVARVAPAHDVLSTRSDYESVRSAWIRQIDANPAQPDILGNAAAFFEMEEPSRSEELLKRALRLQPENKFRLAALANFYTRAIAGCDIYANRCSDRGWITRLKFELESSDDQELVAAIASQLLSRIEAANSQLARIDDSFPLRLLKRAAELR